MDTTEVNRHFGNVDLYLFDQILKDRFHPGMKILDAGCGEGRNLMYFINSGYDVYASDIDPEAIRLLSFLVKTKRPDLAQEQFQVCDISGLPFKKDFFHLVIASAVLHFARDLAHFNEMFKALVSCLRPGGMLFIRMTSNIGIEDKVKPVGSGRFLIPDGTERFLLTPQIIESLLDRHPLDFLEPLKTVNVDGVRCMSTLILTKFI